MNNIFKALNVKNQEEMDKLIESFELDNNQYIAFYSALNENMSPEGLRFVLEKVTKNFYNGSYEKLVEQYKKPISERVLKSLVKEYIDFRDPDPTGSLEAQARANYSKKVQDTINSYDNLDIKMDEVHSHSSTLVVTYYYITDKTNGHQYTVIYNPDVFGGYKVFDGESKHGWYGNDNLLQKFRVSTPLKDVFDYVDNLRNVFESTSGENVLKEMPMTKDQYDKLKVGSRVKFDKPSQAPQPEEYDTIIDKNDDEIKTQFRHHGGKARTVCKWKPEHFRKVYSVSEYSDVLEPKHKIGDRVVTMNKIYNWNYAGSKIINIIPPHWQDGDEAHYSYVIRGITMDKELGKPVLSKETETVPVETIDGLNESAQSNVAYDIRLVSISGDVSEVWEQKIAMTLPEAKKIAEDLIKQHLNDEDFFIATVEKGKTNWGKSSDEFYGNHFVLGITNKDEETAENILGDEYYDFDKITYALTEDTVYDHSWYEVKKQKYPKRTKQGVICEAKEVEEIADETITEEPVEEEKPETTKDPKLQAEIEQMNQIVDTTNNEEVLNNLLQQVDAKLPLTTDTEQMNKLAELKQKIETKLQTGVSINESYNPDDEEWFDIGDQVCFQWGGKNISGTIKNVKEIGGNRYYQIASYNNEDGKVHNYIDIDPIGNEMKRCSETIDVEYTEMNENASIGGTNVGCIANTGKGMGKVVKRKKKKMVDEIENHLFKEYVLNDVPCEVELNGHKMKFFENEGKWYMSVDNALVKTFDKNVMMETADEINYKEPITAELLEGYSCYEMNVLMEDGDTVETVDNNTEDAELANILSSQQKTLDMDKNPEVKQQNIQAAKDMNMKSKGQNVQLLDPETSLEKDVKFIDGDEDDGIGYIQDEEGKVSEVPMNLLKTKG